MSLLLLMWVGLKAYAGTRVCLYFSKSWVPSDITPLPQLCLRSTPLHGFELAGRKVGGVRHCQDGGDRSHNAELQNPKTYG